MKNNIILLISPEGWGQNFVSKHHYANYLSKHNRVYFLNPVKKSKFNPFGSCHPKIAEIKPNLFEINYLNLIPRLNKFPKFIQRIFYQKQAKQIQRKLGIKNFDIVWNFDPYRFWDQTVWRSDIKIYHTVDFHPYANFEHEICRTSDYIFGVTDLVNQSIKNNNKKIIKIGHAADIDGFKVSEPITIPGKNKIKACYTGNFHKHIDYETLVNIVEVNNEIDFIMIGPTLDSNLSQGQQIEIDKLNKLKTLDNIYFIGSVPSSHLMSYLSKCHINLVLFKKEFEKIHCSPHKLMGYFYSGNVTVSTFIDEHKETSKDIILMEEDISKIPNLIKHIGKNLSQFNSDKFHQLRREFAIANSYVNRIELIFSIIDKNK